LLLDYADRRGLLDKLLADIQTANPYQYEQFQRRLSGSRDMPAAAPGQPRISLAHLPATGPDLFGRERELDALDHVWADPQTHVLSLVAWGGVGKTALVNRWLLVLERAGWRGAERAFGWSFYSQGAAEGKQASADPFIDAALRWFGDPDPTAGSPWDKGERLAELVKQRRTLLILDGLEPLQNPPPAEAGRIKDPGLCCLLRSLAYGQPGLCVVTTRLPLADLAEFTGATHVAIDLENLLAEVGVAYLSKLGVRGNLEELREAAEEYNGHALALTLLGGLLADTCGGDVRRRREIGPLEADSSRGSKVPCALLGQDFQGVVVTDFFSAYSPLELEKAKCWVHLLRDSHDLTKGQPPPDSERIQFHTPLHQLYLEMGLALEEVAADAEGRERLYREMREKLDAFTRQPWRDPDCQRLAKRILDYLDELLLWLRNPVVSADNNEAERALRPAVGDHARPRLLCAGARAVRGTTGPPG
jgi:hypothetical protein